MKRYVFVDEFGVNLGMTRRYARALRGVRAVDRAPVNYGSNITLVFGVGLRGAIAPMIVPGAMDGPVWEGYVAKQLAPALRKGDIVVVDGLGAHRSQTARQSIEKAQAQVDDLPPYSPDYSPAEQGGSKVKGALRAAGARTYTALVRAFGKALLTITRRDAQGWFWHCGYVVSRHPP